jgi:hypothetical protein
MTAIVLKILNWLFNGGWFWVWFQLAVLGAGFYCGWLWRETVRKHRQIKRGLPYDPVEDPE